MSDTPRVDVIVPVHNSRRPVQRAVASILRTQVDVRVTIVAHNVPEGIVKERLSELHEDPRVRILELADGVRSPANAFNRGLDAATGEFVCIVGSDDELEEGALEAWIALADRTGADAVVAPIVRDGGGAVPTPRVRRRRFGAVANLDRDRLFERTAPLGLQRRATTEDLRYTDGLPRGVDQAYGLRLWNEHRIVFDPAAPAYLEHADQRDRVTHVFGPLVDDFVFINGLRDTLHTLTSSARRAVVAKTLRVHLLPAVRVRLDAGTLSAQDRAAAASILRELSGISPSACALLPRNLAADVASVSTGQEPPSKRPGGPRTIGSLLPIALRFTLHRHAPLRSQWAGRRVARVTSASAATRRAWRERMDAAPLSCHGRIVVLAPHGSPMTDALRDERGAAVIGWTGRGGFLAVPEPHRWLRRLWEHLGESFPARLLMRLLGIDAATRFAAAVRRTPAAAALLKDAEIIVAADADATFAAWQASRGGDARAVVYGQAAALAAIAREDGER